MSSEPAPKRQRMDQQEKEAKKIEDKTESQTKEKEATVIHPLGHKNLLMHILSHLTTLELIGVLRCSKVFHAASTDPRLWKRLDLGWVSSMKQVDFQRLLDRAGNKLEWLSVDLHNWQLDTVDTTRFPRLEFLRIDQSESQVIRHEFTWAKWLTKAINHRQESNKATVSPLRIELPEYVLMHYWTDVGVLEEIATQLRGSTVTINNFARGQCSWCTQGRQIIESVVVRKCVKCNLALCCRPDHHWGYQCHVCSQFVCTDCAADSDEEIDDVDDNEDDHRPKSEICKLDLCCERPECVFKCLTCDDTKCKECYCRQRQDCKRPKVACTVCKTTVCQGDRSSHYCLSASSSKDKKPPHVLCSECIQPCDVCEGPLPCRSCRDSNKPAWDKLACECDIRLCDRAKCSTKHILKHHMQKALLDCDDVLNDSDSD